MYQAGRSVAILNANVWGNQSFQEKSGWERAVSFNIAVLINKPPFFCRMGSEPGSGGKQNRVSDRPHGKKGSEGIASPDVLKLLGHLRWGSVQFFRDILLFVGLHGVELLTEVSINHILRCGKMRRKSLNAQ